MGRRSDSLWSSLYIETLLVQLYFELLLLLLLRWFVLRVGAHTDIFSVLRGRGNTPFFFQLHIHTRT